MAWIIDLHPQLLYQFCSDQPSLPSVPCNASKPRLRAPHQLPPPTPPQSSSDHLLSPFMRTRLSIYTEQNPQRNTLQQSRVSTGSPFCNPLRHIDKHLQGSMNLPPGFRFYPTDEELVVHFLCRKASLLPCHPNVIPDLDMELFDPWELEGKALEGDNQWYFFSRRSDSRASPNGCWRAMGVDETISCGNRQVGIKKSLVFYVGDAQTTWAMDEYRLSESGTASRSSKKRGSRKSTSREWVLCRVYDQSRGGASSGLYEEGAELSCLDEVFLSLDDLDEISLPN